MKFDVIKVYVTVVIGENKRMELKFRNGLPSKEEVQDAVDKLTAEPDLPVEACECPNCKSQFICPNRR